MKIYIAVTNDLLTDNRIHKVATTLQKSGADITLLGRIKHKHTINPAQKYYTKRFKLLFKKGAFFYLEYNLRLFFFLIFHRFDIIVSNDLDTLLGSYLASMLKAKKIIYDSHEYFTEVPELVGRKFTKNIWISIEKIILPKIKYSYTVCESISITYKKLYGIDMKVVRNVPYYVKHVNNNNSTPNKTKIILYQGSLNLGRGIEHMIDAMQYLDNFHLNIIGDGDIASQLKQKISEAKLESKVSLLGRIPFENLMDETKKADLGLALEENIGLNYYYALPNKLFDYIQARIPVLVSPFPEMKRIVDEYNIGDTYSHKSPEDLAKKIKEIFESPDNYSGWKKNTEIAAKELCWENEEKILKDLYANLGLLFNS